MVLLEELESDVPVELLLVPLGLALPAALPVPVPELDALPEVDGLLPMLLLELLERRSRSRSACETVDEVSPDALPLAAPVPVALPLAEPVPLALPLVVPAPVVPDELEVPLPAQADNATATAAAITLAVNLLM